MRTVICAELVHCLCVQSVMFDPQLSHAIAKAKADERENPTDIGYVAALLSPSIMTQVLQALCLPRDSHR